MGLLIAQNVLLCICLSWIFYDSALAILILAVPVWIINGKRYRADRAQKFEKVFFAEYKSLLKNITSSLEAGHSVENAFAEAERSHEALYGRESVLLPELATINSKVALKIPVEKAFLNFSEKFPYEEVVNFANIFSFGKRLGGNYIENLRKSVRKIEEKVEVREDIQAMVAQKQLELYVMSIMPAAIILYMRIGSPGFLDPVYHNITGIVVMTICLVMYVAALAVGKRITAIEV